MAGATAREHEAVRRAALDYIDGFYTGDSTLHLRSISPAVRKYGYSHEDGAYAAMAMEFPAGFMNFTRAVREGRIRTPEGAPREVIIHEVLDQTASAKVVAWWGIDYLHLARENGRWMIVNILWQSPPLTAPAS
ncbi:MAG: nuclear transport factor 2 family protein [Gemmatimonadaceae bacterium]|nr:nuclear transport factor 2 family protein [Gemmatimonadaceae bacterium]